LPAIDAIVAAFGPLIDATLPVLIDLIYSILPIFTDLLKGILVPLVPALVALLNAFMPIITDALPVLIDIVKTFLIPVLNTVIQIFKVTLGLAIGAFQNSLQLFTSFLKTFTSSFKGTWEAVSGFFKGIINGMIGMFEGFANSAIDGINGIIGALNKIQIKLPAIPPFFGGIELGVNIPKISKIAIPRLAKGGIVMPQPGGVFANIAEAGKPEAVIPLDRLGSFGASNNYNITVNAGMGADGSDIGRQIVDAIVKYERGSGRVFARA